jgi:hypothetical protein
LPQSTFRVLTVYRTTVELQQSITLMSLPVL